MIALIFLLLVGSTFGAVTKDKQHVVIVGAGAAGIAAAKILLGHPRVEVTILEAENRIGGRIHTVDLGGVKVDLGADETSDGSDNHAFEIGTDYLNRSELEYTLFSSDRSKIDDDFNGEIFQIFSEVYPRGVNADFDSRNVRKTMGDVFLEGYNKEINKKYASEPNKLKFAKAATDCLRHFILSAEGAKSWFDPAANFGDYNELELKD